MPFRCRTGKTPARCRVVGGMAGLVATPSERKGGWAAMMRDPTSDDGSILTGHTLLGATGTGASLQLAGLKAAVVAQMPAGLGASTAGALTQPSILVQVCVR